MISWLGHRITHVHEVKTASPGAASHKPLPSQEPERKRHHVYASKQASFPAFPILQVSGFPSRFVFGLSTTKNALTCSTHLLHIMKAPPRLHGKEHHLVPSRADGLTRRVSRGARHPLLLQRVQLKSSSVWLFTRVPVFVHEIQDV